jgi:hypothetical protein
VIAPPLALLLEEIVPQGAAAQETVQLTPLWPGSLPTVAMMFGTVAAAGMEGASGATDTVTDGSVITMSLAESVLGWLHVASEMALAVPGCVVVV